MIKDINGKYTNKRLIEYINKFPSTRILVIGDIILDEYVWGDVSRISPEAPVPVVNIMDETRRLGGAANVLNNIISLGGQAILCGVTGDDESGKYITEQIENSGITPEGIITDQSRCTSV
ncbi:bifunctional heptose 7-phosphate kinase/heptose 1-phosphate adenyltransferase, partial [Thermodesulfobacteriota bacterium]